LGENLSRTLKNVEPALDNYDEKRKDYNDDESFRPNRWARVPTVAVATVGTIRTKKRDEGNAAAKFLRFCET